MPRHPNVEGLDALVKVTYEGLATCLETGKTTYGPVVVFAGPKNRGKSLVQYHILTPLLGGRIERPYQYMSGQTSFNSELLTAGHLMLEDEVPAKDIVARRRLGSYIKQYAANKGMKLHGKGKEGKTLYAFSRLSVSVNDEAENLDVLPPLDDSLSKSSSSSATNSTSQCQPAHQQNRRRLRQK